MDVVENQMQARHTLSVQFQGRDMIFWENDLNTLKN